MERKVKGKVIVQEWKEKSIEKYRKSFDMSSSFKILSTICLLS